MSLPKLWDNSALSYDQLFRLGAQEINIQIDSRYQIARNLLCFVTQFEKVDLIKIGAQKAKKTHITKFYQLINRYNAHEPLSKITGLGTFYDYDFYISNDTLDPRPETELIIDLLRDTYSETTEDVQILDIGTGCGCLAITAALKYENADITAIDISEQALEIAKKNAAYHDINHRISFELSHRDLSCLELDCYDVILCNPPYIPHQAQEYLDKSVVGFDPHIALFDDQDGVGFYKMLASCASKLLKKDGCIFIEFGIGQAKYIKEIFAQENLHIFLPKKDRHGIIRAAKVCF